MKSIQTNGCLFPAVLDKPVVDMPVNLPLLVAQIIPRGELQSAESAEEREKIIKRAVDSALHIFFYSRRRAMELDSSLKTAEFADLMLSFYVSHETMEWMRKVDIEPKLTPILDKGAMRLECEMGKDGWEFTGRGTGEDDFRKWLSDNKAGYAKAGNLMNALKEWIKSGTAFRWMARNRSDAEQEELAEELFRDWLTECNHGDHYLIRRSDALAFLAWKEEREKSNERTRAADYRKRQKAAKKAKVARNGDVTKYRRGIKRRDAVSKAA